MTIVVIPLYPIFYLFLPNIFLNFFITFTPNTIPSKTAIPVLNALIMHLPCWWLVPAEQKSLV